MRTKEGIYAYVAEVVDYFNLKSSQGRAEAECLHWADLSLDKWVPVGAVRDA